MTESVNSKEIINKIDSLDIKYPDFSEIFNDANEHAEKAAQSVAENLKVKPFNKIEIRLLQLAYRESLTTKAKDKNALYKRALSGFIRLRLLNPKESKPLEVSQDTRNWFDWFNGGGSGGSTTIPARTCDDIASDIGDTYGQISDLNARYGSQCQTGGSSIPSPVQTQGSGGDDLNGQSTDSLRCARMANRLDDLDNHLYNLENELAANNCS